MNIESLLWVLITTGEQAAPVADWPSMVRLADSHGVAPLLYNAVKKLDLPAPAAEVQVLAKNYYQNAGRAQVLKLELDRLGAAFDQAGLSYLPLKGAVLAWTVYPDPALRPMYDLDLLIQPGDLLKALKAVESIGYRLDKLTYHAVLRGGPEFSVALELHWCLPGAQQLPPISTISRSEIVERFTYLYCVAHLLRQHAANPRLIWLYDLHLLKKHLGGGEDLAALAQQLGLQEELEAIQETPISQKFSPQAKIFENTRDALKVLPTGTRLRLVGALLFPSKEYMLWRYKPQPRWLWWAWYGRRWMGLIISPRRFFVFSV